MKKPKPPEQEAAFVMQGNDRFYAILASNCIRYDQSPDTETVLVFFVIRRGSGLIDVFNIMKTFKGKNCISRNVQSKLGIPETKIAAELDSILHHFTEGIQHATGFKINWHKLDLSCITDHAKQIQRIRTWNRVNVFQMPEIGLN